MKEPRSFQQKVSPKGKAKKIVGPAGAKKTKRRSPPGGKALARLHFFEQQRGLRETDTRSDKPTQLKDAKDDDGHRLASSRSEALARISLMPAVPVAQGWRPIGPFSIPHGQTYGSGPGSRPSISGRISAIAVDPANANHILIGAAGGGVWETRNLGATWAPRTDNQASLATGAIAFTPSNSSIVYAGTGEGNFFSWLGAGLLRSTDGGATWTSRATAPFVGLGFYSIIVDPLDANHLLAATSGGLFESSDAGATWTSRRTQMTWDISMHPAVAGDPNSTKEIIAASTGGVFRSTDGGTTWSAVNLPSAPTSFSRIAVCHSPSDGSVAYVFAASGATAYLWRRTAFGGAFTQIAPLPTDLQTQQAWYDWFAAVAPNNSDVIYLGAINCHKGTLSGGSWSWVNISARTAGDSIHPDQHTIAFSPTDPNVVYIGCDGGIYRSPDGGTTWRSLNKGLSITEFEFLAQHPQYESYLLGGTQDNGTLRYEGQEVWFHVADGDGGDCAVGAVTPYTCYHTYYNIWLERSTTGGGWASWTDVSPPAPGNYASLFYPPLEVNGATVARAGESVFLSRNSGGSWQEITLPSGAGIVSALSAPTPSQVYVGSDTGSVFRIDFTGGTWQPAVALGKPRSGFMSDLLVDPTNANRLWATFSGIGGSHVFRSDNGGTTWNDVSGGLPNLPINAIEIDPANPNTVYVAADMGVYRTTNSGAAWASFSNGLPNALVKDLFFHQPARLLRAGTQSRGVWEIAVDSSTMPNVEVYLRDSTVDSGRSSPSPSGVDDPFSFGDRTYWWECADVKVDAPSFQTPLPSDVDFEVFEDDHGVSASGLQHENEQRSRTVRVFVQVHNRGLNAATNAAVKVFFGDASLGLPPLPANFWTGFPNNAVPGTSPWQPIAPHATIPSVSAGRAEIVEFDWPVPATAAQHSCLLAIITADNDSIATTELDVGTLVINNKKCGLKNLTIVDPPPGIGPRTRALKLNIWKPRKGKLFALGADAKGVEFIRGIVLTRQLSKLAQKNKIRKYKLNRQDEDDLLSLIRLYPGLEKQLDVGNAYVPTRGVWFKNVPLNAERPEMLIALINPKAKPGSGTLMQLDEEGRIVGGFTIRVQGPAQTDNGS